MLRRARLLPILGVLLAGSAQAGTLTNATWFQVMDTSIPIAPYALPMTRTAAQLGAAGSSTASSVAVSLSYPAFSTSLFVSKTPNGLLDLHVFVSQGGPQAITATAGMAIGAPGVPGTVIVMTAPHAVMGANQSIFMVGVNTIVKVPLRVGQAGAEPLGSLFESPSSPQSPYFTILGAIHVGTVSFFAWTAGSLMFSGLTSLGSPLPNVTAVGSFNLTPWNGGGMVTLVSPSKVSIDGPLAQRRTVSFTKLVMNFVPEPGTLLLLGAAGLALWLRSQRAS